MNQTTRTILRSTRTWSVLALVAALLCLATTVLAIGGTRAGWWGFLEAAGMLRWVVRGGLALLVVSVILLTLSIKTQQMSAQALSVIAIVAVLIPVVGILVYRMPRPPGPPINDISTDLEAPPAFDALIPLRPRDSNPVEHGGGAVAARQRELYPDIRPIESDRLAPDAFQEALRVAQAMGWEIVAQDPQRGRIEAVDTTTFFRFKDDVVIRVQATDRGSRVDIRSRSRVGRSDLGKNAARIREFVSTFSAPEP